MLDRQRVSLFVCQLCANMAPRLSLNFASMVFSGFYITEYLQVSPLKSFMSEWFVDNEVEEWSWDSKPWQMRTQVANWPRIAELWVGNLDQKYHNIIMTWSNARCVAVDELSWLSHRSPYNFYLTQMNEDWTFYLHSMKIVLYRGGGVRGVQR